MTYIVFSQKFRLIGQRWLLDLQNSGSDNFDRKLGTKIIRAVYKEIGHFWLIDLQNNNLAVI